MSNTLNKWVSKNFSKVSADFKMDPADDCEDYVYQEKYCKSCDRMEYMIKGVRRGRVSSDYYTYPDLRKRSSSICSYCPPNAKKNVPAKIYPRNCNQCGKSYQAQGGKSKYCSRECSVKFNNEKKKKKYDKTCLTCGKDFITNLPQVKTCSDPCKKEHRRKLERKRPSPKREPRPERKLSCKTCGTEFKTKTAQKYCKKECRPNIQKKYDRKCLDCDNRVSFPKRKCDSCRTWDKPKPAEIYEKYCPTCGKHFKTKFSYKVYCKKGHSPLVKEYKRLRKRAETKAKLSCESWNDIKDFVEDRPEGFHLDHIIPLNHPDVCGLHNTWNFQWLSPEENMFKTNEFDGTNENDSWKLKL